MGTGQLSITKCSEAARGPQRALSMVLQPGPGRGGRPPGAGSSQVCRSVPRVRLQLLLPPSFLPCFLIPSGSWPTSPRPGGKGTQAHLAEENISHCHRSELPRWDLRPPVLFPNHCSSQRFEMPCGTISPILSHPLPHFLPRGLHRLDDSVLPTKPAPL